VALPDPDTAEVRRQFEFHRREYARHEAAWIHERQMAAAHEQILNGLRRAYPMLTAELTPRSAEDVAGSSEILEPPRPKGLEALRSLLGDEPGVFYTTSDIIKMQIQRGWIDGATNERAGVRAAIQYAVVKDHLEKKVTDNGKPVYAWKLSSNDSEDEQGEEVPG